MPKSKFMKMLLNHIAQRSAKTCETAKLIYVSFEVRRDPLAGGFLISYADASNEVRI